MKRLDKTIGLTGKSKRVSKEELPLEGPLNQNVLKWYKNE